MRNRNLKVSRDLYIQVDDVASLYLIENMEYPQDIQIQWRQRASATAPWPEQIILNLSRRFLFDFLFGPALAVESAVTAANGSANGASATVQPADTTPANPEGDEL